MEYLGLCCPPHSPFLPPSVPCSPSACSRHPNADFPHLATLVPPRGFPSLTVSMPSLLYVVIVGFEKMQGMIVHVNVLTHTGEHEAETLKQPEEELEHNVDLVAKELTEQTLSAPFAAVDPVRLARTPLAALN